MTRMMDMCEKILRGCISLFIRSSSIIISDHSKLSKMFLMENYVTHKELTHFRRHAPVFRTTCPYKPVITSCFLKPLSSVVSLFCLMANDWFNKGFVFYDSVLQVSNISGALEVKYTCKVAQAHWKMLSD